MWTSAHIILRDITFGPEPFSPDRDYICGYIDALRGHDGAPGNADFSVTAKDKGAYLEGRVDGVGDRERINGEYNEEEPDDSDISLWW